MKVDEGTLFCGEVLRLTCYRVSEAVMSHKNVLARNFEDANSAQTFPQTLVHNI